MKNLVNNGLIWFVLSAIFLLLAGLSFYCHFHVVGIFFLSFVLLNILLFSFDCRKCQIFRFFIFLATRYLAIFFLGLFLIVVSEFVYPWFSSKLFWQTIKDAVYLWPVLFIVFFLLSRILGNIIMAVNKQGNNYPV